MIPTLRLDGVGDELTVRFTTHLSNLMPNRQTRARVVIAELNHSPQPQDYVSQTQMDGSSSPPRTDPALSPINAFPVEELYAPEFSNSLQDNTGYWQTPNPHEYPVEQVATSPEKKKKATQSGAGDADYVQKAMIHYEIDTGLPFKLLHCWEILKDHLEFQEIAISNSNTGSEGGSKRHKSSDSSSFNTESREASINRNTTVGDNNENEVQKIRRPKGRDKAKAVGRKNKGSKSAGSSNVNEDSLARLMVTEMTTHEKEEHLTFLDIKRREMKCREQEIEQQDMGFYLQPYDHLTGDQQNEMDEIKAKIKAKYNLQY
nr:hypothetical protein [Tanacetum cinerariifolium]